jgi:stage II sporulation protein D
VQWAWDWLKRFKRSDGLPLLIILAVLGGFIGHYCFFSPEGDMQLAECGITVQVRLATTSPGESLDFSVDGPYKIFKGVEIRSPTDDGCIYYGYRLRQADVSLDEEQGLMLNGHPLFASEMVVIPEMPGSLRCGGTRYSGIFQFSAAPDGRISIINTLDLEHYLAGVLFKEMPHSFHDEALKAQLVAARSYARYRQSTGTRILTDDSRSQVYGGLSAETSRSVRLVKETFGEVLMFDGRILPAYYSSTCGGISASASEVFTGKAPPPVDHTHPCGYCTASPFYEWRAVFTLSEFRERFELPPGLERFEVGVTGFDSAKRATEISFVDARTPFIKRYPAETFRRVLNRDRPLKERLLSTRIDRITMKGDQIIILGKGFGHGVGLCQYGAEGLAREGKTYLEILDYYYKGAEIYSCYGAQMEEG